MTALPPNPYTATSDSVETRGLDRITINDTTLAEVVETILVRADGAREVTRATQQASTTDGRVRTDKTIVVVCDTCHAVIAHEASCTCVVCKRIACGRCIHRVHRQNHLVEVCSPCRWRTLPKELLRLS